DISDDVGTMEIFGNKLPTLIYEHQDWSAFGYDLYQILAVAPDRLYAGWLYCATNGDLQYVYYEGTDGTPLSYETATGTCSRIDTAPSPQVSFPAVHMPQPQVLTGFTVTGPEIDIQSGTPGWIDLGAQQVTAMPFNSVDCSTTCGTPGWW